MWKYLFIVVALFGTVALQTSTNDTNSVTTIISNGTTTDSDWNSTTTVKSSNTGDESTKTPYDGSATAPQNISTTETLGSTSSGQSGSTGKESKTTTAITENTTKKLITTTEVTENSTKNSVSSYQETSPTTNKSKPTISQSQTTPLICHVDTTTTEPPSSTDSGHKTTSNTTKKPIKPRPTQTTMTTTESSEMTSTDSGEETTTTTTKTTRRPILRPKPTKTTTTTEPPTTDPDTTTDTDTETTTETTDSGEETTTTTTKRPIRPSIKPKPTKTTTTTEPSTIDPDTTTDTDWGEETTTTTPKTTRGPRPTKPTTANKPLTTKVSTTATYKPDLKKCNGRKEKIEKCPSSCPEQSCDDYSLRTKCIDSKPKNCRPECRCKSGYYRNSDGDCVKPAQCLQSKPKPIDIETNCDKDAYSKLILSKFGYSAITLKEFYDANIYNSILVSGSSVLYLLAELALSATGLAYKQLMSAISWIDQEQINCIANEFYKDMNTERDGMDYGLFLKIYAGDQCPVTNQFKKQTTEIFKMGPDNVNFGAVKTTRDINTLVEYTSKGYIIDYIKYEMLSSFSDSSLILMNAQTFKGRWEKQFNPRRTTQQKFMTPDGKSVLLPMMCQQDTFKYTESSLMKAQIVEMRYDEHFSFAILLPKSNIKDLLNRIQDSKLVLTALNSLYMTHVEICIPKFKLDIANSLKRPSQMAGLTEIFNNQTTGLKKVASCNTPYVSEIFQKLVFEVNELGPTNKIIPEFPDFDENYSQFHNQKMMQVVANKPFVFYLLSGKKPIFAGLFTGYSI